MEACHPERSPQLQSAWESGLAWRVRSAGISSAKRQTKGAGLSFSWATQGRALGVYPQGLWSQGLVLVPALPQGHRSLSNLLAASTPFQTLQYIFSSLQSASCRLSNCSVIYCKWLQKEKKKKEKKQKKIPRRYNIVLSVNQTFPVMLIACVSLMYFILLKSFETLQLSSYRPLCGYH